MRDRPARRTCDEAQIALLLKAVHFVDDAIDLVRQARALLTDTAVVVETTLSALHDAQQRRDLESEFAQLLERFAVSRRHLPSAGLTHAVEEHIERTRRREPRIELSQAARRRIAWIDEDLLARRERFLVHGLEARKRHEDFAADLEDFGSFASQSHRDGLDRLHVVSDIFAARTVAAGGGLDEHTVLVAKTHGQTVELGLCRVLDTFHIVETLTHAPVEIDQILLGKCIVEREHRCRMHDFPQLTDRCDADALSGRIGSDELRMRSLDVLQLAHQPVVLGVRHRWIVEYVVAVVVTLDLLAKLAYALFGLFQRSHESPSVRRLAAPSRDWRRAIVRARSPRLPDATVRSGALSAARPARPARCRPESPAVACRR